MAEAWLRGPVPEVPPLLMPVAHSIIQSGEDLGRAVAGLTPDDIWLRPGGAAAIGFHLRHIPGTIDRLLTYARGEALTPAQLAALAEEGKPGSPPATAAALLEGIEASVERMLAALRAADERALLEAREVGRARLPSTVLGLLFHAAEHTHRHTGQIITTAKIIRGLDLAPGADAR